MSTRHFVLTNEPLDENLAAQIIEQDGAGGVVTFVGRVRDEARGHKVTLLEYEAYPEMVERVFADIAAEARKQFPITDVAIHHRVGALEVGDVSVVIAVSAPHRAAAFDACRYAIDRLEAHRADLEKGTHARGRRVGGRPALTADELDAEQTWQQGADDVADDARARTDQELLETRSPRIAAGDARLHDADPEQRDARQ